jgi:hypothetical protein
MNKSKNFISVILFVLFLFMTSGYTQGLIIDHTCVEITKIPQTWIEAAKSSLHIAYGHTSHGSQITSGMAGLVAFANGGGKGLSLPENIFAWNNGGTNGALDLHDYAMSGDVGYYPDWVNNTRSYLGDPDSTTGRGTNNPDVNIIMWSWCGQMDDKYSAGTLNSEYIEPLTQLEEDYPGITFIYMTGHAEIGDDEDNKAACELIRNYCKDNDKVLFDFNDIEHYDPDGTYYEFVHDNCNYYSPEGDLLGNWATEWQNAHTENVDWYNCSSAHSQPLNANQKAYAVWWMWACLAGWEPVASGNINTSLSKPVDFSLEQNYPNPFNPTTTIRYTVGAQNFVPLQHIDLSIYNILGQKIATLISEKQPAGAYQINFDASHLPAGIYFYKLAIGNFEQIRRMVLVK